MKKYIFFTIMFLFSFSVYAKGGQLKGYKNIEYISTQYFDIIFPEESRESAQNLAREADKIYIEILKDYSTSQELAENFRIPVVITPATDLYNAYFTNGNFNHIVLLDTSPEEDMAVFSNPLIDTFRHELTHAVTINFRSPSLKKIQDIAGDIYSWGCYIVMTSFFKEGASVSQESRRGQGRLNDPWYLHMARQAKINNDFPSWADVTGSRDIFPSSSSAYGFGGPFTLYLQQKYGMKNYADFWYTAINDFNFTFKGAFKDSYGISISEAWKDFYANLYIPETSGPNPVKTKEAFDFFYPNKEKYSSKNSSGYRYTMLTGSKEGFAFIENTSSSVYFTKLNDDGICSKAKKLFSMNNICSISLSSDGKFLAINYYDLNHFNIKKRAAIYSIDKKKFIFVNEYSLTSPALIKKNEGYILAAVKTFGQREKIIFYRLNSDLTLSKSDKEIPIEKNARVYGLCGGENKLSLLYFKDSLWSIREYKEDFTFDSYKLDEASIIKNLSYAFDGENKYVFSWAQKDTLPRLGLLKNDGTFSLQEKDISGGIYWPQKIAGKIYYSGYFVKDYKLLILNQNENSLFSPKIQEDTPEGEKTENSENLEDLKENQEEFISTPWEKLFYSRGIFIPFSQVPLYSNEGKVTDSIITPGLSYMTSTPWDSDFITLGAGWNLQEAAGGAMLILRGGSSAQTSLLEYSDTIAASFDKKGYRQSSNSLNISSNIYTGRFSKLIFSEQNILIHGRQTLDNDIENANLLLNDESSTFWDLIGSVKASDNNKYFSIINTAGLTLTNMHKTGPSYYAQSGISFTTLYGVQDIFCQDDSWQNSLYQYISPQLRIGFGRLIPIDCKYSYTYNLPLYFTAKVTAESSSLANASVQAILFSKEIQKGLTFIPLYFNRISIAATYSASINKENESFELFNIAEDLKEVSKADYEDTIALSFLLTGSLNTGIFASPSGGVTMSLTLAYHPNKAEEKNKTAISLAFSLPGILSSLK